ncbi:MerR family transcriptional regulator [Antrihabitans cavernicola]|uniref:MerR family transcriptional regulator n=1 Tax=Antrihabitans cavernicola TaxID=2495913 RepID=A0A5A7SBZ2_9NOCA|nr:MerR family transcriptional regulator [Spelaeibacter cavernicola]KAA0023638.1 MerR family transcriptional regulator [Spelaeibacter cavernicola]
MTAIDGTFKVGELAHDSGLTVRALRYYDQIGLLQPSRRSEGGHRLYGSDDVHRLYRICLLRKIGFALDEIARVLDDPGWDLEHALRRHLELIDHQVAVGGQLRRRLAGMIGSLACDTPPTADELIETMEEMTMLDSTVERRISILVYDDITAIHAYLVRVFGLGPGRLDYDDAGRCVHGEVDAGDGMIWLHQVSPEFHLASPQALGASTGTTAVMVDDVDAHYSHAVAQNADILYPPTDMPYGYREYSARDPEGGLWSFMKPLF